MGTTSTRARKVTTLIPAGFPKWELVGDTGLSTTVSPATSTPETTGAPRATKARTIRSFCACHQLLTFAFLFFAARHKTKQNKKP